MSKKKRKKALWWSSLDIYENCPKKFLYKYGIPGEVDRTPAPKRSEHHIMMGVVIQAVIEDFYNDKLWLTPAGTPRPTEDLVELLVAMTKSCFRKSLSKYYIEWHRVNGDEDDLLDTCLQGVLGYLKTIKEHHLLGDENAAERRSVVDMGGYAIGAKPDVIIKRTKEPRGITIIDGKNTKNPDGQNPDQLRMYALIFYREFGVMPTRLGFAWYRYPPGAELPDGEISTGVTWIPFDKEDLEGIALRCEKATQDLKEKKFPANPVPKYCKYCDWEELCEERQAQRRENAAKRKKKPKPLLEGKSLGNGFFELEMGDD